MKKKFLFLLVILLLPLNVCAIESCAFDDFGVWVCKEDEPDIPVDDENTNPNPEVEDPTVPGENNNDEKEDNDNQDENQDEDKENDEKEDNENEPIELTFDNTKLSYLKIINYGFSFDPDVYEYKIKIPYDLKELYIIATSYDGVSITGAEEVNVTSDLDEIVITTSYGGLEPSIYKIKLKRDYTKFILLGMCGGLSVLLVLAIIYAIINRSAYLEKMKSDKNKLFIPEQAIEQSSATPQQIKVVKSVITPSNIQPKVIKKQIVINTSSGQPFKSVIAGEQGTNEITPTVENPVDISQNINPEIVQNENNIQ